MRARWIPLLGAVLALAPAALAEDGPGPETDPAVAAREAREARQIPRLIFPARDALARAAEARADGDHAAAAAASALAVAYDPGSFRAYLALGRETVREPRAAIELGMNLWRATTFGFPNQLVLSLNVFLVLFWSLTLGIVGTGGAVVFRYIRHVHHTLYESLQRRLGSHAAIVATVLLFVPVLWGAGLIATLVFFLLWFRSIMRPRERSLAYACAASGLALWIVHFLAPGPFAPPGESHGPYRVGIASEAGGGPGHHDMLDIAAPNGFASWTRGIVAVRKGELTRAIAELETAARILPRNHGVYTGLGTAYFRDDRIDEALAAYRHAEKLAPGAPEPVYNLAQVLNERLDYIGADEATERATSLGYDAVAAFAQSAASAIDRPAMDVLPPTRALWSATLRGEGISGSLTLPAGMRFLCPGGMLKWTPVALLVMITIGVAAGTWLERSVRTYACGSCGKIVCRRCLVRVSGRPYCLDCGQTLSAECSAEYSRALLERYFHKGVAVRNALSGAVRWLLPGWAEVSEWPVVRAVFVLSLCGAALLVVSIRTLPVPGYPIDPSPLLPDAVLWALGAGLYALARLATWRWSGSVTPETSDLDDIDDDEPELEVATG